MDNQLAKLIKEQREEFRGFIPDMMVGERIMTTRRLKEVHSETTTALLKEVIKMVEEPTFPTYVAPSSGGTGGWVNGSIGDAGEVNILN